MGLGVVQSGSLNRPSTQGGEGHSAKTDIFELTGANEEQAWPAEEGSGHGRDLKGPRHPRHNCNGSNAPRARPMELTLYPARWLDGPGGAMG